MIFGQIKTYAIAALAAVVGVLGVALKIIGMRSRKIELERDYLKARANRERVIAEKDNELEAQERSRRADIARDLDDGSSDFLDNPNDGWLRNDKDDT